MTPAAACLTARGRRAKNDRVNDAPLPSPFETIAAEFRAVSLTIVRPPGQYRGNPRGGIDAAADTVDHGRAVAAASPAPCSPPSAKGRRKWRKLASAKAARRAFIRMHNRRLRARALRRSGDES